MRVDRILYPVETLGPGKRAVIWTAGCSKHCAECANPELWTSTEAQEMPPGSLARYLLDVGESYGCHELTLTGGDPLEQPDELLDCLEAVRNVYDDVLLYTGYTLEEAQRCLSYVNWLRLRTCVDVLIDGPYIAARNVAGLALRGSDNQRVNFLNEKMRRKYAEYMGQGRWVQNFVFENRAISVGIHDRPSDMHARETV